MTAVSAHLGLDEPPIAGEAAERRRIARIIGIGSASFTLLIVTVALILAVAA